MGHLSVFLIISVALCANLSFFCTSRVMAAEVPSEGKPSDKKVYIVYLETWPETTEKSEIEAKNLELLASVVGSHEAAESSILYTYTEAAYGFAAKLSPEEVDSLTGKPGVLAVVPSRVASIARTWAP